MKKLFYVVLVVAILFVISAFVKKNANQAPVSVTEAMIEEAQSPDAIDAEAPVAVVVEEEAVAVEPIAEAPAAPAAEAIAPAVDAIAPAVDATTEAEAVVVEEDIEEANPDATKDEGETVVTE